MSVTWPVHIVAILLFLKSIFKASQEIADPVKVLMLETGESTILLLLLTLLIRPLTSLVPYKKLILYRRTLGLWSFASLTFHLLIFLVLYTELSFEIFVVEVIEHPYVIAGMISFVLLLPLAITSTKNWQRKLRVKWVKLHKLVYFAVFFGLVHIALQLREEWLSTFGYSFAFLTLMLWRVYLNRKKRKTATQH